ncbi:MAG: flagellin [Halovenus sp.]
MASLSASSLIIFIAAIAIAAGVSGVMIDSVDGISQSITTHGDDVQEKLDTEISIISDTGSDAIYDDGNETVHVLVKNIGARQLPTDADRIDTLVDGEYIAPGSRSVAVISNGETWREGDVIELTLQPDAPLETGEHRVAVIVDGDREVLRFYL